jgi:hypothetical protein
MSDRFLQQVDRFWVTITPEPPTTVGGWFSKYRRSLSQHLVPVVHQFTNEDATKGDGSMSKRVASAPSRSLLTVLFIGCASIVMPNTATYACDPNEKGDVRIFSVSGPAPDGRLIEQIDRLTDQLARLQAELQELRALAGGRRTGIPRDRDSSGRRHGRAPNHSMLGRVHVAPVPPMPPVPPIPPVPPLPPMKAMLGMPTGDAPLTREDAAEWKEQWEHWAAEYSEQQEEMAEHWREAYLEWANEYRDQEDKIANQWREYSDHWRDEYRESSHDAKERARQLSQQTRQLSERLQSNEKRKTKIESRKRQSKDRQPQAVQRRWTDAHRANPIITESDGGRDRVAYDVKSTYVDRVYKLLAPDNVRVIVSRSGDRISVQGTDKEHDVLRAGLQLLGWIDRDDVFKRMRAGENENRTYYNLGVEHAQALYELLAPNNVRVVVSRDGPAAVSVSGTKREHEVLERFLKLLQWM